MNVRIVLVDDHNIIRDGLKSMLEKQSNIEVVAEANNGRNAVDIVRQTLPNIVVMDVGMPELNGIDATCQILSEFPKIKILALSMHSDKQFVLAMLKSGASGYLLKNCAFNELIQAIETISDNKIYLSPSIANLVLEELVTEKKDLHPPTNLTSREREVLQLLTEGKTTKQIAMSLHISASTVETHRRQTMEKLDLHNIAELTKYAIREGLTTLEQ
ncbi:MAG: response regulator transcription factor [Phycisphaerae bacterium]|nr:response regulator transcription factor [Phycisphaerae bacterium]